MSIFESPRFLRNVLVVDAASGAASSLLHLLGAGALTGLLGIPHGVLVMSGVVLLAFVAAVSYAAACDPIPRGLVSMLIAAYRKKTTALAPTQAQFAAINSDTMGRGIGSQAAA